MPALPAVATMSVDATTTPSRSGATGLDKDNGK